MEPPCYQGTERCSAKQVTFQGAPTPGQTSNSMPPQQQPPPPGQTASHPRQQTPKAPLCLGNAASGRQQATAHQQCPVHLDRDLVYTSPAQGSLEPLQRSDAGDRLTDKIKAMQLEEDFRWENPHMCRKLFKYRGICGSLGNPVFTSTPVPDPGYKAQPATTKVAGYPKPRQQHPMYKTSSATIGETAPCLESMPISYHPCDQSFTITQAIGGMYEDGHLTTEVNSGAIW